MNSYYCVKVGLTDFSCTKLEQKYNTIILKSERHFNELISLKNYIKNKKNINFLLFETNFLKYHCSLSKNITDKSSINQIIYSKLQKTNPDIENLRFKYNIVKDKKIKDTTKYSVNGLYQNSKRYEVFNKLKTYSNCNLITLENYALYSLCKKLLPNNSFISIWYYNNKLVIVAGNKNELIYSRNETIETQNLDISNELIKNIIFIKQKVRGVNIDLITINGSIFNDEVIYTNIYNQLNIPVSILIPTKTLFKDFNINSFNKNIIEIGSLCIDYPFDFTSKYIKSHIQYSNILKYYICIIFALFLYLSNSAFTEYTKYKSIKEEYNQLYFKVSKLHPIHNIQLENEKNINTILNVIKATNNENLLIQIKTIKDSINYINSSDLGIKFNLALDGFSWKENEISHLKLHKHKKFNTLANLNTFKNKLKEVANQLNKFVIIDAQYNLGLLNSNITFTFKGALK